MEEVIGNGTVDLEKIGINNFVIENNNFKELDIHAHSSTASRENSQIDVAAEAKFVAKMDYRVVPILFLLCKENILFQ